MLIQRLFILLSFFTPFCSISLASQLKFNCAEALIIRKNKNSSSEQIFIEIKTWHKQLHAKEKELLEVILQDKDFNDLFEFWKKEINSSVSLIHFFDQFFDQTAFKNKINAIIDDKEVDHFLVKQFLMSAQKFWSLKNKNAELSLLICETIREINDYSEKIIKQNYQLLKKMVARIHVYKSQTNYDEILQVGLHGLLRATELFNPNLGFKFSTYAATRIFASLQSMYLRKTNIIAFPSHVKDEIANYLKKKEKIRTKLNGDNSFEALAKELNLPLKKIKEWEELLPLLKDVSLDAKLNQAEDDFSLMDQISSDTEDDSLETNVLNSIELAKNRELIGYLSQDDQNALSMPKISQEKIERIAKWIIQFQNESKLKQKIKRSHFNLEEIYMAVRNLYEHEIAVHELFNDETKKVTNIIFFATGKWITGKEIYHVIHNRFKSFSKLAKNAKVPHAWIEIIPLQKSLDEKTISQILEYLQKNGAILDEKNFFNLKEDFWKHKKIFNQICKKLIGRTIEKNTFYNRIVQVFGSYKKALNQIGIETTVVRERHKKWSDADLITGIQALVENKISIYNLGNDYSEKVADVLEKSTGRKTNGANFYQMLRIRFSSTLEAMRAANVDETWATKESVTDGFSKDAVAKTLQQMYASGFKIGSANFFDISKQKAAEQGYLDEFEKITQNIFGQTYTPKSFVQKVYTLFNSYYDALLYAGLPTEEARRQAKPWNKTMHAKALWALHRAKINVSSSNINLLRDENFRRVVFQATGQSLSSGKPIVNQAAGLYPTNGWREALENAGLEFRIGRMRPIFDQETSMDARLTNYFGETNFLAELKRLFSPLFTETDADLLLEQLEICRPFFDSKSELLEFLMHNPYLFSRLNKSKVTALKNILTSEEFQKRNVPKKILSAIIPLVWINTEFLNQASNEKLILKAEKWNLSENTNIGFNMNLVRIRIGSAIQNKQNGNETDFLDTLLNHPEIVLF